MHWLLFISGIIVLIVGQSIGKTLNDVIDGKHGTKDKLNVLLLVIDDMRPQFGAMETAFGGKYFPTNVHPHMKTPNMDRLAASSAVFTRAHVQYPLCAPSRSSFLTGRRPDSTRQYHFTPARMKGANFTTIPQLFKENGYKSYGVGKIFHQTDYGSFGDESDWSFSEKNYWPSYGYFWNVEVGNNYTWLGVTDDLREEEYAHPLLPDEQVRNEAVAKLKVLGPKAASGEELFFMATGFQKPHCPYIFPHEYFDLYEASSINAPASPNLPQDFPELAWFDYLNLRRGWDLQAAGVTGDFNTTVPLDWTLAMRRAYYAAISYVDNLIGDVLREVENQGLANNTVIAMISDHGYTLGEHREWTKQMLYDLVTQVVMTVKIPGVTDAGVVREQLTELVDIFPTLVDAAGLEPVPLCEVDNWNTPVCTEGISLVPLIKEDIEWKDGVFSQQVYSHTNVSLGNSMTTENFRYTEYVNFIDEKNDSWKMDWCSVHAVELYDHRTDPAEDFNVANDPKYKKIRDKFCCKLRRGWRCALPQRPKPASCYSKEPTCMPANCKC